MKKPNKKSSAKTQGKKPAPVKAAVKKTRTVGQRGLRREGKEAKRARAIEVIARLKREYPEARCSLDFQNPFQLLVATILSAQCTDERVNQVTPGLFRRYPGSEDLAGARTEELEELIRPTGFFRNKAKSLLGMSNALVERHNGRCAEMDELVDLPGVGRNGERPARQCVRQSGRHRRGHARHTLVGRLGLTANTDAVKIEQDLLSIIPRADWTILAHLFIDHGRAVCKAPKPRCAACVLNDICPSSRV
jgi:endonuclease-3